MHAYLDGVIRPPDRQALDRHLAGCEGCQRELAATRTLLGMLADAPRRPLSADFDRALNTRLAELGPRRSPWPVWSRLWQMHAWRARPALVPLAAALAAVVALQSLPPSGRTPSPAPLSTGAVYVAKCVREHAAVARWQGAPEAEAAVSFNVQVSSVASIADDLIQ
jgi:anti-sigma factor RsiW